MRNSRFLTKCLLVSFLLTFSLQACGTAQPLAQSTPTLNPTNTPEPSPTLTPTTTLTPTRTPTPTVTPNLTATQQYEDFMAQVQKVYEAGQISTLDGTYEKLDDFSDHLAMSYGYSWLPADITAKNFIIRADFEWEVANQKNYSGCGYVFRQTSEDHYYMMAMDALNGVLMFYTKLGLDEFGHPTTVHTAIRAVKKEKLTDVGTNPYHAKAMLVVNESNIYLYINDEFYTEHRLPADRPAEQGTLSYLVLTGSATDYGTRCRITMPEIWIVDS